MFLRVDARVCIEVDISKPLKMEIKNKRGDNIKSALIDYKNLTNICYGCGQQDHKFENCPLFTKAFSSKIEKRQVDPSLCKDSPLEDKQARAYYGKIPIRNPKGS